MKQKEGYFNSFDGTNIFYRKEEKSSIKGIVLIVHGIAEHSGRYEHVKDKLLENRYRVYRFDHRGHGRSGGRRGDVRVFNDFIKDVDCLVDIIKRENSELPLYILGHSMGGLITACYGIRHGHRIDGEIISGAPTGYISLKTKLQSVKFPYVLKGQVSNSFGNFISRNPKIIDSYKNDELVLKVTTIKLNLQLSNTSSKIKKDLNKYQCPCLILHGRDDKIVPCLNSSNFYKKISSTDKKLRIYDGLYHEILNEVCRDDILKDICQWLDDRVNTIRDEDVIN
jgi:acylglycerol lipase